jgi:hypothetical protein
MDLRLAAYNLKQLCRTNHVRLDEYQWPVYAAIDVTFSGEVQNSVNFVLMADARNQFSITDVATDKLVTALIDVPYHIADISGVGE